MQIPTLSLETPWGQSGWEDDGDDVEKEDFGVCAKNNNNHNNNMGV